MRREELLKVGGTTIARGAPPALATMIALTCLGGASVQAQPVNVPPAEACSKLEAVTIDASRIGLPTRGAQVDSAKMATRPGRGGGVTPEHCLVSGHILPVDPKAPSIDFQLALPAGWNGKALMLGGGGLDGSIPNVTGNVSAGPADQPTPLARGYATFGSDSGHQAGPLGSLDGAFGENDEALTNWAGADAVKKTRDVAIALIQMRYGAAPKKSYFVGGSTGGREAATAIQRWPADWDGAIAWYPAAAQMVSILGGQHMSRALAKPGAYLNGVKREALFKAAMQACDGLDGVKDGIISDQGRCNARFNPSTATVDGHPLRCPPSKDADTCLTEPQIQAVKAINGPTRLNYLASGQTGHPGYNIWGADTGMTTRKSPVEDRVISLAFNRTAPRLPVPDDAPYITVYLDQWLKHHVTRDPTFNSLAFDPEHPGAWGPRISQLSLLLDAKTDLSGFAARGGKLLLAHGTSDVLVSTRSTEDYYRRLERQFGAAGVRQFVRFYEVPGYGHAASTVFNASWDSLTALEDWAERGKAPVGQVTVDTVGVPGRSRPMCEYPTWPRYKGHGDVNAAASFTCVR